ncbi:MAG: DUF6544 family protein [Sulfitobacter sp.]
MGLFIFVLFLAFGLLALVGRRILDHNADRTEMDRLLRLQPESPKLFQYSMIADLPEPARRYFAFAIAQNTPLLTVADLRMTGQFSLRGKGKYMKMRAHQVLAAPYGFIWKMRARSGLLWLSGSDSAAWTRFWIGEIAPVARFGGDTDHARAAFGRTVAEAVFWTPAALLPGPNVTWQSAGPDTAKVTVHHQGLEQSVDIVVANDGQPISIKFARWSDANPQKLYQLQPFGGYLSHFQTVQGYQIPTQVEAGNFFGTDWYFPFYIVDVDEIRYPQTSS